MYRESIWGTRMAFIIVDPQRKFSLKTDDWDDRRNLAVENINLFARMFRERGLPVIFVYFEGESHIPYGDNDGDDWLPGIESSDSDIVVHKKHMSCFKETELEQILRENKVDCVLFGGMLTEFCVMSTYFSASERGFATYLAKDALIPYNKEGNQAAEVICSIVTKDTVERFINGKQPPMSITE
jgi:nicotinamidase-related amidase